MWNTLTDLVNSLGYLGIFTATSLEYGCFPVSSEVLLPFIGYFVNQGGLSLFGAIAVSTLGGVVGSLFCYFLGRFGKHFIEKKLCVRFKSVKKGIDKAKEVFRKYGKQSVFIARVFPIARTYISFPAGLAGMGVGVFTLYTFIGALIWNTLLISAGFLLGEYWSTAGSIISDNHVLFYIILMLVGVLFISFSKKKS